MRFFFFFSVLFYLIFYFCCLLSGKLLKSSFDKGSNPVQQPDLRGRDVNQYRLEMVEMFLPTGDKSSRTTLSKQPAHFPSGRGTTKPERGLNPDGSSVSGSGKVGSLLALSLPLGGAREQRGSWRSDVAGEMCRVLVEP